MCLLLTINVIDLIFCFQKNVTQASFRKQDWNHVIFVQNLFIKVIKSQQHVYLVRLERPQLTLELLTVLTAQVLFYVKSYLYINVLS